MRGLLLYLQMPLEHTLPPTPFQDCIYPLFKPGLIITVFDLMASLLSHPLSRLNTSQLGSVGDVLSNLASDNFGQVQVFEDALKILQLVNLI